jgi:hypothetical protein
MNAFKAKDSDSQAVQRFSESVRRMMLGWHEDGWSAEDIQECAQPYLSFIEGMRENDAEDKDFVHSKENGW